MKVRKKPIVVEAFRWQAKEGAWGKEPSPDAPEWFKQAWQEVTIHETFNDALWIDTLEGPMKAKNGDYVIRGVRGELYPCKADIFAETYEEVTE